MLLCAPALIAVTLAAPFSSGASSHKQAGAPWGLARISHRNYVFNPDAQALYSDDNNAYFFSEGTQPVTVYMLDTGVDTSHPEFQGRAVWGPNYVDSGTIDDNGHGTHLAGIAVGSTKGVARNATVVSVKILDSQRLGSVENFGKAVDWVVSDLRTRGGKGVINYSAVGPISELRSQTVQNAVDNGLFLVNAGGNAGDNACNYGPANAGPNLSGFLVAAALNYTNGAADFSNTGPCIDVWAPGVDIQSSLPNNAYGYMDGTSNAAAFVTGLVAYIWSLDATVSLSDMQSIVTNSNKNAVSSGPSNTTGSIVYNDYFG